MSVAEIQDNKWEVEASKPPIMNPASIGMMFMMGMFTLFFLVVIVLGPIMGSFADTSTMDFGGKALDEPAE